MARKPVRINTEEVVPWWRVGSGGQREGSLLETWGFDSEQKDLWILLGDPWLMHLILPIFSLNVVSMVRVLLFSYFQNHITLWVHQTGNSAARLGLLNLLAYGNLGSRKAVDKYSTEVFFRSVVIVTPTFSLLLLGKSRDQICGPCSHVEQLTFTEYFSHAIIYAYLCFPCIISFNFHSNLLRWVLF